MSDTIIVALISGTFSIIAVLLAKISFAHELDKKVAVIETKLETIQTDVKEHNHYAKMFSETMPVVQEQIKVINHRIQDLENGK